jgi:hypothetical protein
VEAHSGAAGVALASGFDPVGIIAAEFRRMQAAESTQRGEIIRSRGIRMP